MRTGKRMAGYLLVILVVSLATTGGAFLLKLHLDNARQQSVTLPFAALPVPSQRILIFAPHCDDETLGTGGLIARAVAAGTPVHVVLMTNGDGFTMAAAKALNHINLTPADYVRFGNLRQKETLRALKVLGLSAEHVTFLSFPDRGLGPMWDNYWTPAKPYRSHYTARDHSPYDNSLDHNAPYYGLNVLADVKKVITRFKPTDIYVTHANDEHPDHWGSNCFVNAALESLREQHRSAEKIRVHSYLIHRGDWPVPQGLHRDSRLVPPEAMADEGNKWELLPLDRRAEALKYRALLCYTSQVTVTRRFLLSFVRKTELFGEIDTPTIARVTKGTIEIDGKRNDWSAIPPLIRDPILDKLTRKLEGSGDIRALYLATDGERLFLRLETRWNISPQMRYRIRLHPLTGTAREPAETVLNIAPRKIGRWSDGTRQFASEGRMLEVGIPLVEVCPSRSLYVGVDTQLGRIGVDRSAWELIRMAPECRRLGGLSGPPAR